MMEKAGVSKCRRYGGTDAAHTAAGMHSGRPFRGVAAEWRRYGRSICPAASSLATFYTHRALCLARSSSSLLSSCGTSGASGNSMGSLTRSACSSAAADASIARVRVLGAAMGAESDGTCNLCAGCD